MADIIIVDDEFDTISTEIRTKSETTEEMVTELKNAYGLINSEVAKEGVVADNFKILSDEVGSLSGGFAEIYELVSQLGKEFVEEIDDADSYFY